MEEVKTKIPGIYKVGNGVLINKDEKTLKKYKMEKMKAKKMNVIEEDLLNLKKDIDEIKALIKGLVK